VDCRLRRTIVPVALLASRLAAPSAPAGDPKPNKFSVSECKRFLAAHNAATKTMKAILEATKTSSCAAFKLDARGRTELTSIDLSGRGLTDLTPFHLLRFIDGEVNVANNDISDIEPLVNAVRGGPYRINLSRTKVASAELLAKSFGVALVLDGDQIDDPARLGAASLASSFSMRGNRSRRGADYDHALESMYRLYAQFSSTHDGIAKPASDLDGLQSVLAPKVTRYITLKDVTAEAIAEDTRRFYRQKDDIYYRIHLDTFKVEKRADAGQVLATFDLDYGWRDHDLKVPHPDAGAEQNLIRGKRVSARVSVVFDPTGHIVSYMEKTAPCRHLVVVRPTWGTKSMVDALRFVVDGKHAAPFAKVPIPKGAAVEDAFEYLSRYSGNKYGSDDEVRKVVFQGKTLWAWQSSSGDDEKQGEIYIEERP
jgi:hypothetical protein